jgi:hypothetical protein
MRWDYGNSDGNCWKSGKFALGVVLLGMAWKLSQMMRPALVLSTGICWTPLLMSLDPDGYPWGMRPSSSGKMRPSDSTVGIGQDMSQNHRLGLLGNGSEGFP